MAELHEGCCVGGPLDGETAQSRFPKGFLLVDRPADRCWVYEWSDTGVQFEVRDPEPMPVDRAKRHKAAEEPNYDVLAAPWVGE